MTDELGDRMKEYEQAEAGRKLLPLLPVLARIDGKTFHNFTVGLEQPYDKAFRDLMTKVTSYLVTETQAKMGYTQSDEISLVWYSNDYKSKIFFDGKIQKMTSVLTSYATAYFNSLLHQDLPSKQGRLAHFDCRVWQVPTLSEAANAFLWREKDATRNSIESAARTVYSHKQLHKAGKAQMMDMLMKKGINWNDYPAFFKRGTYVQRKLVCRKFTTEEIENLPMMHKARTDPNLVVERHDVIILDMPPISKVTNRIDVIFNGEDPIMRKN